MLNETDFIIPVFIDHADRLRNLKIMLSYLKKIGATNVYVREYFDSVHKTGELQALFPEYHFSNKERDVPFFNKMTCVNEVFKMFSRGKVVSFYDVDVLFSKKDLIEASDLILKKQADVVYPYNGYFYDVPAETVKLLILTDANYLTQGHMVVELFLIDKFLKMVACVTLILKMLVMMMMK